MTASDTETGTWKKLPGAQYVEVCDRGGLVRVLAHAGRNGRFYPEMVTRGKKTGTSRYWQAAYTDDKGKRRKRPVHILVLDAHVGPRPIGREGCHGHGEQSCRCHGLPVQDCNDLRNLRWDWPDANRVDRFGTAACETCDGTGRVAVTESDTRRGLRRVTKRLSRGHGDRA